FSMPHYGPFSYAIKNKKWEPSKILNPNESYIIQNVQFYQLPGDNFYSIFLEILSEEPPLPLFSVPIVLRKGEKILDGLVEFKEKDFLKENLKTDFIFDETSGKLNIVSPKGEVEMSFDFIEGNFQPSQVTRN
ncbi:MAG: hypothetical protein KDK36_16030, partial [Leptospiraceae bacterium]|nr:hypothetical protein [Leptospiraceae bacterium]